MMFISPESRPICLSPHHLDEISPVCNDFPRSISQSNFNYDLGMMKEKGGSLRPCKATKTIPLSANIDPTGIGGKLKVVDSGRKRQHADDRSGNENNSQRFPTIFDSTPDKHRPNVHLRKRSISNFGSTAQSLDLGNVSDSPVQLDKKKDFGLNVSTEKLPDNFENIEHSTIRDTEVPDYECYSDDENEENVNWDTYDKLTAAEKGSFSAAYSSMIFDISAFMK
ncbi:hypothetical protein ACET3Z_012659 [Daucus carota]